MKTKSETEAEILTDAKNAQVNEEIKLVSVLNIRNLDSVHPQDCGCDICKPLRHEVSNSSKLEQEQRIKLDYYR